MQRPDASAGLNGESIAALSGERRGTAHRVAAAVVRYSTCVAGMHWVEHKKFRSTSKSARCRMTCRRALASPLQTWFVRLNAEGKREIAFARWGLEPFWAEKPKVDLKTINGQKQSLPARSVVRRTNIGVA